MWKHYSSATCSFLFTCIGSVLYDKCLIVENPSARNGVVSIYDNVRQKKTEQEPAYKSLNQAERESPSPYQSLIKPANEVKNQWSFNKV